MNVNGIIDDNLFYFLLIKVLIFGIGGVDDVEDVGIIVYEYGYLI